MKCQMGDALSIIDVVQRKKYYNTLTNSYKMKEKDYEKSEINRCC